MPSSETLGRPRSCWSGCSAPDPRSGHLFVRRDSGGARRTASERSDEHPCEGFPRKRVRNPRRVPRQSIDTRAASRVGRDRDRPVRRRTFMDLIGFPRRTAGAGLSTQTPPVGGSRAFASWRIRRIVHGDDVSPWNPRRCSAESTVARRDPRPGGRAAHRVGSPPQLRHFRALRRWGSASRSSLADRRRTHAVPRLESETRTTIGPLRRYLRRARDEELRSTAEAIARGSVHDELRPPNGGADLERVNVDTVVRSAAERDPAIKPVWHEDVPHIDTENSYAHLFLSSKINARCSAGSQS